MPHKIMKKSYSLIQKKILKDLIDADLSISAAAKVLGHQSSNASAHFLRENEDYFQKAIQHSKKKSKRRNAAVSTKPAEVSA